MSEVQLAIPTLDDSDRITSLINRSESFDGVPRILQPDEFLEELDDPTVDLARDCRIAIVDTEIVGWILIRHTPSGAWLERAVLDGNVDPLHRGTGIGTQLMTWGVEQASNRLRGIDNDLPKFVRTYAYEQIADLQRLVSRLGFVPVRWFEELLLALEALPPASSPSGVTIIPWPDDRDEELRHVKNASFADHWGSIPISAEDWGSGVNGFGSRLDLSFAATDSATGALIGHCLNKHYPADEELLGRRDGWIDNLGTLREWRGRGIASSLIAHSLNAFAEAGFSHASIGVDTDSPTGASRLYRSFGFEPQHREIVSEIEII